MIVIITNFLPYLLLLYFIYRSLKEPIFLLGIPFLIFIRHSIFFDKVKLFSTPGSLGTDIILLVWLSLFWIIIRSKNLSQFNRQNNNLIKKGSLNSIDYIIIGLIIVSIIDLIIVNREYFILDNTSIEFISLFSLFLGFFIIKDIIRRFNYNVLAKFLFSLVVINTLASFLYILHQGLHFEIYQGEEYSSEIFQGEVITRTFWFMPVLWFFSISYIFVFLKNKSVLFFTLLAINLLALYISYTRSFVIIAISIIILYYLLIGYKKKNFLNIAKNLIIIVISGLTFFALVSYYFPINTNYFLSRFTELNQNPTDEESNSLIYRFDKTGDIIDKINEDKLLIGYGPITDTQLPLVENMRAATYDLVWTGVMFRWGYIGIVLFVILYVVSVVKAFYLFIESEGVLSYLALLLLLIIISQIIESFISSTFMSLERYPMGLWYLGMLSALILMNKNNLVSNEEGLDNE